jgi:hypothetical protein
MRYFAAFLAQEQLRIGKAVKALTAELPDYVRDAASYALSTGGKRLRPALAVLCARALGHSGDDVYTMGAPLEMLHVATLMHDDILDNSETRRSHLATHLKYGVPTTLLAADAMVARAFQSLGESDDPRFMRCLSKAVVGTMNGEIMEIAPLLKPGTPVIVAEKVAGEPFYGRDGKALPAGEQKAEAVPASPALPSGSTEVFGKLTQEEKTADASSACVHAVDFPVEPTPAFAAVQTAEAPSIRDLAKLWMALRLQKSEEIFTLYDSKAWPAASREKFSLKKSRLLAEFKDKKEFRIGDDLSILYGPGYWVSCFTESYALKNGGRHSDLRALYWMKDASGRYRIIGEARISK